MPLPTLEALGISCLAFIVFLFVRARRRAVAADSESSDDESTGPLSVSVVTNHEESDSLLPKFAGLLRSPWHRGAGEGGQKTPKMMQPVQKVVRKMSLTMPLPLRKKRKPEVLSKKYHAPYFFPLLDETAQCAESDQEKTLDTKRQTPWRRTCRSRSDCAWVRPRVATQGDVIRVAAIPSAAACASSPSFAGSSRFFAADFFRFLTLSTHVYAAPLYGADVLDDEGIWNTGMIVDVGKDAEEMVEIKYDGWGDEYNQWIEVSKQRLAPLHTFTIVKKCWAKLTKWPWWPAFVVLRAPSTPLAQQGLEEETKLYVEFYDSFDEDKRSRCWMQKKNVVSFRDGFEERASKNIGKNFPKYVEGTQRAKAGTSPMLFSGPGTLPIEYSSKMAEPLEEKRKDCTPQQWFQLYKDFSQRYQELYGYSTTPKPSAGEKTLTLGGKKTGKRAPGRPAVKGKQAKGRAAVKDEPSEGVLMGDDALAHNEDESEEKEEEPEADQGEEEEEEDNSADEEEDYDTNEVGGNSGHVKLANGGSAEVRPVLEPSPPEFQSTDPASAAKSPTCALNEDVVVLNTPSTAALSEKQSAESPAALNDIGARPVADAAEFRNPFTAFDQEAMGPSRRRKELVMPPTKLVDTLQAARKKETAEHIGSTTPTPERDPDFYRHWSGGSRYEVDRKPWTIQAWLVHGVEQKLQE
ncbi:hypothetical protein BBJ28_00023991 [Nothophytophthora sp. Chile5]|nr:hypothetical protein BBJ28_00023991 [Nothophytophthora sp. Chile5]